MAAQLGVMRAAIIVWVSGIVTSALLATFVSPVSWALIAGSSRHIDHQWGVAAALVTVNALVAAVAVTFGVSLFDFRVSYASAVIALVVGGILATAAAGLLVPHPANDPAGIAIPTFVSFLWPLQLVLGTLLPAYLVNASATQAERASRAEQTPPGPPYSM